MVDASSSTTLTSITLCKNQFLAWNKLFEINLASIFSEVKVT